MWTPLTRVGGVLRGVSRSTDMDTLLLRQISEAGRGCGQNL